MMSIYATAFVASFANIFLRAFQQKNVMMDKYLWVPGTSLLMACAEYFSLGAIALSFVKSEGALPTILSIGIGGGLGCLLSMMVHNRLSKKKKVTV